MRLRRARLNLLSVLLATLAITSANAHKEASGVNDDLGGASVVGPDLTFCQLYGLAQFGRLGDVVGLSVATTPWNVGDGPAPWFAAPNPEHPFNAMNLYRLSTVGGAKRFEQIGQSWVMHGFCALDDTQCGGTCEPTGCNTLNVNCTNTTSSAFNAARDGLGPRYEVDPWLREWNARESHFVQGPHDHDPIEHRLQVHDADLDPDLNPGAQYFVESFFVCPEDNNQMNSAAWKPVRPYRDESDPDRWVFEMTDNLVYPEIGFAIDAWSEAYHSVVAQRTPVIEYKSPDGRCVLAAEATEIQDGIWRYEYALLNVDMDRQVGSLRIPVSSGAVVSKVGFHAVGHHDEPVNTVDPDAVPIDNSPWAWEVSADAVVWSTQTNPLRWGTLYSFRFDADRAPTSATATLGLFRPGRVEAVFGATIAPDFVDCNDNGKPDACDVRCSAPMCGVPCGISPDCNGNARPDECEVFRPGDLDASGYVDVYDYLMWLDCPTLPCTAPPCDPALYSDSCCGYADLDADGDVDLVDFRYFQNLFAATH